MAKKFASKLTAQQFALARKFERAGLTSISQAVRAFERGEDAQIQKWKKQYGEWLAEKMKAADELTHFGQNDPTSA